MIRITHPDIPGSDVEVPDSSWPFHQAAGWLRVEESSAEQVQGASGEPAAQEPAGSEPGKDATPKRRSTTKESE